MNKAAKSKWMGGLAYWTDERAFTLYLSVAFTWKAQEAYDMAVFYRLQGYRVVVGGPSLFFDKIRRFLQDVAEVPDKDSPGAFPDAVARHNPAATIASRGCPVGCSFCLVTPMEGAGFTLLPDFPVRPVLCDNNLSALPIEYQKYIIGRYQSEGVPLLDANSGFEPITFTEEVYHLWKVINRGPWRFAYDETKERDDVLTVMRMLKRVGAVGKKRVYVLIGNEPFDPCMARIQEVIDHGCEPHVQPYIKLNSFIREPDARFDWTVTKLRDVARWANGYVWRKAPFSEYDRNKKTSVERYDEQQGLFL